MRFGMGILVVMALFGGSVYAEDQKKTIVEPLPEITIGREDAPIVVIEYSSLTCHHCADFHRKVLPALKKKYVDPGLVRIIVRDFPGDRLALVAHEVAWCRGAEHYLPMLKKCHSTQDEWLLAPDPLVALKEMALKEGLTEKQYEACTHNGKLVDQILDKRLKGQNKYGIKETPTLVIKAYSLSEIYRRALTLKEMEIIFRRILRDKGQKKSPSKEP